MPKSDASNPLDCPCDDSLDRRVNTIHDHAIRISLLEQSMLRISKSLEAINAIITKLVWVVMLAITSAVMKFVISGGLV